MVTFSLVSAFTPLIFDTFGGYSKEVKSAMAIISKCVADRIGSEVDTVIGQFRQKLSLALQKILC